jgi:hypothetical protein
MRFSDIDTGQLSFSEATFHRNGMQSVYIKHNNTGIICQTDCVHVQTLDNGIQLHQMSDDMNVFINSIDEAVVQHANTHTLNWFNKEISKDSVNCMFTPSIIDNSMITKMIETDIFDRGQGIRDISYIDNMCKCVIMIELVGVYFAKKRFGLTWNAKQIIAYPRERLMHGYAFNDNEDPVPI